ncbi:DUF2878 domain-containing protein [Thiohalophilus sp.]|uniref:DUF2878 domain-containing protein n=1 Tax=Thiohalophilus sp. TaxID=3028392 RepID=UPI002ACD7C82|nr:DUF2878 domain-containing protein [Thiohalophilus sp.]MDZ7804527.1 DUF2878 domain-containing protein [Thiohalophilus sp.]
MPYALINFLLFQVGWFSGVLGAAWNLALYGSLTMLMILISHLFVSRNPASEILLVLFAIVLGTLWDSWLLMQGWLSFNNGMWHAYLAPHWIILLWALFATTMNHSLGWLKHRYLLAGMLGAIAGPAAYYAGARLGAVELLHPEAALLALSVGWAAWTPLLVYVATVLDRSISKRTQKEFI